MAAMGPVTIKCPGCGDTLAVPTSVIHDSGTSAVVRMDTTATREHFLACQAATPEVATVAEVGTEVATQQPEVPHAILAGRVSQMLDGRHYVAQGKRACIMCGAAQGDCLDTLTRRATPCCAGCHDGNTHPVPQQDKSCAEWAADRETDR